MGSLYLHVFTSKTFVNIHMYALGPSGLFWFGLNLAALNCIELIVVEKEQPLQCTDTDLKVRLLWLNVLLLISWAAVTPDF